MNEKKKRWKPVPEETLAIKTRRDEQIKLVKSWRESSLTVFEKAYSTRSLAAAVKAKCLDCVCCMTVEITNCEAWACPLWNVRPFQKGEARSSESL